MNPEVVLSPIAFTGTVVAKHRTIGVDGVDAHRLDSSMHDEWLLDEALDETFSASDPISIFR